MKDDWSKFSDAYLEALQDDDDKLRRALLDPIVTKLLAPRGKSILDFGCGDGYFARALKAAGATRVTGLDIAPGLIEAAKARDPNGDYHIHDITFDAPLSLSEFDAACAHMVMMDVSDIDAAFANLAARLNQGGRLVVSMINPYYAFPVGRWSPAADQHQVGQYFYDLLYITEYFETRTAQKMLRGSSRSVPHYHRPMSGYINGAARHGLILERLLEPPITPELHERFAHLNLAQALVRVPLFLILSFRKTAPVPQIEEDFALSITHHAKTNAPFYAQYPQIATHDNGLSARYDTLTAQYNALLESHDKLTTEVQQMRASNSWRLTSPLRLASKLLRHHRWPRTPSAGTPEGV